MQIEIKRTELELILVVNGENSPTVFVSLAEKGKQYNLEDQINQVKKIFTGRYSGEIVAKAIPLLDTFLTHGLLDSDVEEEEYHLLGADKHVGLRWGIFERTYTAEDDNDKTFEDVNLDNDITFSLETTRMGEDDYDMTIDVCGVRQADIDWLRAQLLKLGGKYQNTIDTKA